MGVATVLDPDQLVPVFSVRDELPSLRRDVHCVHARHYQTPDYPYRAPFVQLRSAIVERVLSCFRTGSRVKLSESFFAPADSSEGYNPRLFLAEMTVSAFPRSMLFPEHLGLSVAPHVQGSPV